MTTESTELVILNPAAVRFWEHRGSLRLETEQACYLAIRCYRAFPISDPGRFYGITDGNGKGIGLIEDPSELDSGSRDAVESELEKRYFVPVVKAVYDVRDDYGAMLWDVETDRGRKRYIVRSIRDNMAEISSRRLLLTDVDGNRFEIADIYALDSKTQGVVLKSM